MDPAERPHEPVQLRLGGVVARRGPTTWAGMTEAFLALYDSPQTVRAYRRGAEAWGTWCSEHEVDVFEARRADVTEWIVELGHARAKSTVRQAIAAVAGVYKLAHIDGLVDTNPTDHVKRPQSHGESTALGVDVDDLRAILKAADAHSLLAAALYRIYGLNGLRASEPLNVDVGQFRRVRGHWVLVDVAVKGGKQRDFVRLAKSTHEALAAYLAGRATGPLFLRPQRSGRTLDWTTPAKPRARMAYGQADRLFKQLVIAAGLPPGSIHLHDLRHGFVTIAGDAGARLEDTQEAVGHADPRTTRLYDRAKGRIDNHPTQLVDDLVTRGRPPTLFD